MVENNYHVLEEDKEVYSDIWDKEKRALINNEVVDLLNEQEKEIRRLNHLVKIATSLIEWNTIPQIRREWQKHLRKVGDVND